MSYRVSEDGRRMCIMPPIGCYEGKPSPDGWQGELAGTTTDMTVVMAWLNGEEIPDGILDTGPPAHE